MDLRICADVNAVAETAAQIVAEHAAHAVREHGRFTLAMSGGRTPRQLLTVLRTCMLSWELVHLFQVDERIAPAGHPDRNRVLLQETLLDVTPPLPVHVYPMPVEREDSAVACAAYADQLRAIAGDSPVLDLVQLGMGDDGHTASLIPGDTVLDSTDLVTVSGHYQGWQRMTLTYPVINLARSVLWVVTGAEKRAMLTRLCQGDESIPAGRVRASHAIIVADDAAAEGLDLAGPSC